MRAMRAVVVGVALLALAACGDRTLRDLSNPGEGPEEFAIVPHRALQAPPSLAELPPPAPGTRNRADITPVADAVAALGGDPSRLAAQGIPASDAALVATATRYGVTPGIREQLAEEDARFRQSRSRFTNIRIARVDRYNEAYRRQALNPFEVQRIYRAAGARTPSAPPERR